MLLSIAAALVVELSIVVLDQSLARHLAEAALLLTPSVLMRLESNRPLGPSCKGYTNSHLI